MWGFEGRFLNRLSEEDHQVYLHLKDALYHVGMKNHLHLRPVLFSGVEWDPDREVDVPVEYLDYALSERHGLLARNVCYAYFGWEFMRSQPFTVVNVIRCNEHTLAGLELELERSLVHMKEVLPSITFACRYLEKSIPLKRRSLVLGEIISFEEEERDRLRSG